MLTSGIGRVEAQGAFPWTRHTIFVLRPLSGRLRTVGRLLSIVSLVLRGSANFFPLRRAGLKRYARTSRVLVSISEENDPVETGPPIVIARVVNYFREEKNGDRFSSRSNRPQIRKVRFGVSIKKKKKNRRLVIPVIRYSGK